jgi:hypothetical protein
MKRYIKMPLKKALPLLFISALVLVSISGCTSSTNPTATPKAATTTSTVLGFTPLLQKMEPTLKTQFGSKVSEGAKHDGIYVTWTTKKGWNATAGIDDRGTSEAASRAYNVLKTPDNTEKNDPSNVTGFGQAAATAALGHTPTVIHDVYLTGVGQWAGVNMEYLQYDQIFVQISYIAPE